MTRTLSQINRQIEKLQRQAESLKQQEVKHVIGRIKLAIDHYGLTAEDLGLANGTTGARHRKAAGKATARKRAVRKPGPVKYRDEAGNTWTGRGKRPNWFKAALDSGKSAEDLAAAPDAGTAGR